MKKNILFIVITISSLFLSGCVYTFGNTSVEFTQKWNTANTEESVSWWYKGEDSNYYYVVEQKPGQGTRYKLSKAKFVVSDIKAMEPCNLCRGIKLKPDSISVASSKK